MLTSLSDTTDWARVYASAQEVYVWRAEMSGCQLGRADDALLLLRAVAKAQKLDLDAKAVLIASPEAASSMVDVVLTADSTRPIVIRDSPTAIADAAAADPSLRARCPGLKLTRAQLLQLTAPPSAVDFWRQHDIVYDDTVGPTGAWVAQRGAYKGTADQGSTAVPLPFQAPPPLDEKKKGSSADASADDVIHFLAWTAVGAAASWLTAHLIFAKEQHP